MDFSLNPYLISQTHTVLVATEADMHSNIVLSFYFQPCWLAAAAMRDEFEEHGSKYFALAPEHMRSINPVPEKGPPDAQEGPEAPSAPSQVPSPEWPISSTAQRCKWDDLSPSGVPGTPQGFYGRFRSATRTKWVHVLLKSVRCKGNPCTGFDISHPELGGTCYYG
jgi:hypothetical protein